MLITRSLCIAARCSSILRSRIVPLHKGVPRHIRLYTLPTTPRLLPPASSNATVSARANPVSDESQEKRASEIKDAKLIFNQAWKNIEDHYGRENIHLPREFIFLMGAPGSGKGTHTPSFYVLVASPIHLFQCPNYCKHLNARSLSTKVK